MLNKWIGVGRIGNDPELSYTQSGKAVCKFDMAVAGSNKKEDTVWVPVEAWEKQAENCAQYLAKGSTVAVTGRLVIRPYEKDGVKRKITRIAAESVQFLDKRKEQTQEAVDTFDDNDTIPF